MSFVPYRLPRTLLRENLDLGNQIQALKLSTHEDQCQIVEYDEFLQSVQIAEQTIIPALIKTSRGLY